jgi:alpha-beta hydrolase superfamily lysophospholipase
MAAADEFTTTNLELRESNPDGSEGAGLSHTSEGLVLLHVKEMAVDGEPVGCVTVLHDAGDHGGRYLDLGAQLSAAGWAIALPDLRGHGDSEGERGHSWGLLEVVRDVDEVLNHLAYQMPSAPQVLLGQGLGGLYALCYALDEPGRVSALVLVNPLFEPRFELPVEKGGLMKLFKKVGPTAPGTTGYRAEQLSADPAGQATWSRDPKVHDVVTKRAGESIADAARSARARVGELGIPMLVLHGSDDPLVSKTSLAALDGRADLQELPGKRHDPFHDTGAQELTAKVIEWLASVVR